MNNRTRLAAFVALAAIGSLLATAEVSARPGGWSAGRGFHGGFHRFNARPIGRAAPIHAPGRVRPFGRHMKAGGVAAHRGAHGFVRHHRHKLVRHRDHLRHGYTVDGVNVFYGSAADLAVGVAPDFPSTIAAAPDPALVTGAVGVPLAAGLICRSVEETVPRERGGQTQVRVTRCYPTHQ